MIYDVKLLQGIAEMTRNWELYRVRFYEFACSEGGERWLDRSFREHMFRGYLKLNSEPLTTRLYSLDDGNRKLLLRFIDEYVMAGLASQEVEYPSNQLSEI